MGVYDAKTKRMRIVERDGPHCHWCLRMTTPRPVYGALDKRQTLDHLVPKSKGGGDGIANLVIACARCNSQRGSLSVEVWRAVLADRSILRPLHEAQATAFRTRGQPMSDREIDAFIAVHRSAPDTKTKEAARSPERPKSMEETPKAGASSLDLVPGAVNQNARMRT